MLSFIVFAHANIVLDGEKLKNSGIFMDFQLFFPVSGGFFTFSLEKSNVYPTFSHVFPDFQRLSLGNPGPHRAVR